MSLRKCQFLLIALMMALLQVSALFGGTTGKIAGRITDKETGEPLIGVNITIDGTMLGAATDIEGEFVILNIPPGNYTVTLSMIGYQKVTVTDVRVHIDKTMPLNAQMSPASFETEDVVIVAERNLLKKDVSTSVTSVQADELESLPVSSISDVVGMQAGVEDGMVVRGGGADELLFQIDGVTMRDPRNNKPITSVSLSSIKEISIEKGGFNAEYGEVRSGLVNIISREGEFNQYSGSIDVKYSPAQQKYFGTSVYDPNSMWNRPYTDDAVCWTGTDNGNWSLYEQRQYPEFRGWNQVSQDLLSDDDPTNDLSPEAAKKLFEWERRRRPSIEPDYIIDGSFGGPVPFIGKALGNLRFFSSFRFEKEMYLVPLSRDDYQDYIGSLKLTSDVRKGGKLMITASMGKSYNVPMNSTDKQFNNLEWGTNGVEFWNPTDYMRDPLLIASITNEQRPGRLYVDSWYSEAEVSNLTLAGKYTQFITPLTFYEISTEYVNRKYEAGPLADRDKTTLYEIFPGYFVDEAPYGFDSNPDNGITGMFFGGHTGTIRDSSDISSFRIKADLTSQVTKEHMIKTGIDISYYDLDLNYGAVKEFYNDITYVKQKWNPFRLSAYVQDKMEMLGFVANIGVRMDMSIPNTEWADVDNFNEDYFSGDYNGDEGIPMKDAETDISFSPRLGISHPVTTESKIFFNYGHFKQMPTYEEVFRIARSASGQMLFYGNPNLEQAKTVTYELGYDHVLFDEYLVQVSGFYNDISNQAAQTQFRSNKIGFFATNNNSYEDIRGVELSFKKTHGNWVRGFVNFTYQIKTEGQFGRRIITTDPLEQKQLDEDTGELYQQKPVPEPKANANLTFFTPKEYGPEIAGIYPLEDLTLNLFATWSAGEYLTYNPKNISEVVNNVQVVDYYNCDLRFNKAFVFEDLTVMFYMEIRNLFNTKRLSGASFYDGHDQRFYFESLHLPEDKAYDNIPGDDRIGDFREEGVAYQPVFYSGNVNNIAAPDPDVIYWDRPTGRYMQYTSDGTWGEVDGSKMDQILEDKAYIDMPNNTSFSFLNPRQFYFGINLSFNL